MSRESRYNEYGEIIEAERAKLKVEVDVSDEEKKRMQATVKDDEIIHLNIGRQKCTTKRSTLCQVEGSLTVAGKIVASVIKMALYILILLRNILP